MIKNILVIGTSDSVGGAARVGWDLGRALTKRHMEVKYLVGNKFSNSDKVSALLPKIPLGSLIRHFRTYLLADDIDFGTGINILNHPYFLKADIVHCHNLHGNFFKLATLVAICKQKPVVWTLHDGWAITAHCAHCFNCSNYNSGCHFTPGLNHYLPMLWNNSDYLWNRKKYLYSQCKNLYLVSPSRWLESRVRNSILSNHPITVINNGIDTTIFKSSDKQRARQALKLPQNQRIVLFVAQKGKKNLFKGGDMFTKIVNVFPNILFISLGGNEKNITRDKNLINVPYISSASTLVQYYSAADVFLLTSTAENFPLVTLEAMACGLPVVAFDVGGVKEQITHGVNGYIAKYKDIKDMIRGLEIFLKYDQNSLHHVSVINRKKVVTKYNLDLMADRYLQLYNKAYGEFMA
jgi:glycosyltransferase involved in cell wall biosynthesis